MWFGKLKQINPANSNLQMSSASMEELEELLPGLPLIDQGPLHLYRQYMFYDLLTIALRSVTKNTKKLKINPTYLAAACAMAVFEVGQSVTLQLTQNNPAAGELLKRHLKGKIAKW